MPFPPWTIPNTFKCTVDGVMGGHNIANTMHVLNSSSTNSPTEIAADIQGAWEAIIGITTGMISYRYVAHHITVVPMSGLIAPVDIVPSGWPKAGGLTGVEPVPAQCALILTVKSIYPGRRNRGRMFIAGVDESNLDVGGTQWKSASMPGLQIIGTTILDLLNGVVGNKSQLIVASRTYDAANNATSCTARQYLGTQRRRVAA